LGNFDTYEIFRNVISDLLNQYRVENHLVKAFDTKYNFKKGLRSYFKNIKKYAALVDLNIENKFFILK